MKIYTDNKFVSCLGLLLILLVLLCPFPALSQDSLNKWSFLRDYKFDQMPDLSAVTNNSSVTLLNTIESPSWKMDWDIARSYFQQGKLQLAEKQYLKVLDVKDIFEARWELVNVLASMNRHQEALELVAIAFEDDPNRMDVLLGLAVLQFRSGKFARASQSYELLAAADFSNDKAIAGTAFCFLALGQSEKAFSYIERLSIRYLEDFDLQQLFAQQAVHMKRYELANEKLTFLVGHAKATKETFVIAAQVASELGNEKQAESYWNSLLSLDSEAIIAHQWLADYYEKNGQVAKAIDHYLFLNKMDSEDSQVIRKIGQCYVGLMEFANALVFFEDYISREPQDKEAVRFVVNIHAALGNKVETLAALEHYFEIESSPDKSNLQKAAQLYDEHGLAQEAIGIYRRLLELSPDDPAVLTALADNFLELGKDEDALRIWKRLVEIAPKVVEVYKPIATLLEKLGREEELLVVLEVIAELEPSDISVQIQLAEKYLASDNLEQCGLVVDRLSKMSQVLPAEFYRLRGKYLARTSHYGDSYGDFQKFLSLFPEDSGIRKAALKASGKLGDLKEVRNQYAVLSGHTSGLSAEDTLVVAEAFLQAGSPVEARQLLIGLVDEKESTGQILQIRKKAYVGIAKSYIVENLPYEAESVLRHGLNETRDFILFLPLLFELNIDAHRIDFAQNWLFVMEETVTFPVWQTRFAKGQLLLAQGERRKARRVYHRLLGDLLFESAVHTKDTDLLILKKTHGSTPR